MKDKHPTPWRVLNDENNTIVDKNNVPVNFSALGLKTALLVVLAYNRLDLDITSKARLRWYTRLAKAEQTIRKGQAPNQTESSDPQP